MNIKKVSLAAITTLALVSSVSLFADRHMNPNDASATHSEMSQTSALDGLALNENQKLRISAINETYAPQQESIKASIRALDEQHKALDPQSADHAEQVQTLGMEKARLMQEKADIKARMHEESMQVLTDEQRATMQSQ